MRARIVDGAVSLLTRKGADWTSRLPALARTLAALPVGSAWIDGEVVAMVGGLPSFAALQRAFARRQTASLVYFAFDLLYLDGRDLRSLPLRERRTILERVVENAKDGKLGVSETHDNGQALLQSAFSHQLEGIMAKRLDRPYTAGRSHDWLKVKCWKRQEFVVGGITLSRRGARAPRELLVGVHERDGSLRYVGTVAAPVTSGRRAATHPDFSACVAAPFFNPPAPEEVGHVVWVTPTFVAEVRFLEWTSAGGLRQAQFVAYREDKPADEIVMEVPVEPPPESAAAQRRTLGARFTHADRIIDEGSGLTKGDVASYYADIAQWMLPHIHGRPVMLARAPTGIAAPVFYQKHAETSRFRSVEELPASLHPGHPPLLVCNSPEALLELVQLNVIEIHTWNATAPRLDRPDRFILDLDPDPALPWSDTVLAARLVRGLLEEIGLTCFLKTSGGKGLHIVVPIQRRPNWSEVKAFTHSIAQHLARVIPSRFSAVSGPSNRIGKIFVDYLRNGLGATTAAAFSVRARPGLPVSVPVSWDELEKLTGGDQWDIRTARERVRTLASDPWEGYGEVEQALTADMRRRMGKS